MSAAAFRGALPSVGSLSVLSWDRTWEGPADAATMGAMVRAAQRGSDLVVLDLPRHLDEPAADALVLGDALLVVASAEVRGVASAQGMLSALRRLCADIRVIVRELPGSDLTAAAVADALGLPLAGRLPTQRSIARAVNDGLGPLGRWSLERVCSSVLEGFAEIMGGGRR